jgi:hypothetical protein
MQDLFGHEESLKRTVIDETMSSTIEEAMAKLKGKDMYDSLMRYLYTIVAVGTWRLTKTVYDIDPVFFKELNHTKFNSSMKIPSEVLTKLPDWCVYIRFPDGAVTRPGILGELKMIDGYSNHRTIARDRCREEIEKHGKIRIPESDYKHSSIKGIFAFIDSRYVREVNDFYKARSIVYLNEERFIKAESTLVLAIDDGSFYTAAIGASVAAADMKLPLFEIYTLPLGDWTIEEAITPLVCWHNETDKNDPILPELLKMTMKILEPYLNTVMYLCSVGSDIRNKQTDKALIERKPRQTIPGKIIEWDVGKRIGSIFSKRDVVTADSTEEILSPSTGLKVRPHWRRAHFHLYWTGKNRETPTIKWVEPTLINASLERVDALPEVVRPVTSPCNKTLNEEYGRAAVLA